MPSPRTYDPRNRAFTRALDALRPVLEEIPHGELLPIRLDITSAIITAFGVLPRVAKLREAIVDELGADAASYVDRLEITTQACARAHALYLTTIHGTDVEEKVVELGGVRRVLLLEAQGLVAKKRLAASSLAEIVGGTGYKAMCIDVLQLVSALRADWSAIEAHTPVTSLELDQAEALADAVAALLGEAEQASASSPAAEMRQRAYTHFMRTYDEVRRAVACVRWEQDDADDFAPSLFANRERRRDDDTEIDPVITPIVPIVPIVAGPTNGPAPSGPVNPDVPGAPPFVTS